MQAILSVMHSVPITIPGALHNFTLTYIHSQLSSFAYSNGTHYPVIIIMRLGENYELGPRYIDRCICQFQGRVRGVYMVHLIYLVSYSA